MAITLQSSLYNADVGPSSISIPSGTKPPVAGTTGGMTTDPELESFIQLFLNDVGQKRKLKNRNPILMQVAAARALDLATRKYVAHRNPDGHYANYLVRQAGYKLPSWYAVDDNNIESIAAGQVTAVDAWTALVNHQPHRIHVLGELQFYSDQIDFGLGHWRGTGSIYSDFWVILTART
jgi:uncharacterized protein YkwD